MSIEFRSIQKQWYGKLREEGFEDIESHDNTIERWHCSFFQSKYTPTSFQSKQSYYILASQFLESHSFGTSLDHQVWKLHSEGITLRKIAKETELKTCQIFKIVKNLKKQMMELI